MLFILLLDCGTDAKIQPVDYGLTWTNGSTVTAKLGDKLNCSTNGNSPAEITWSKDGSTPVAGNEVTVDAVGTHTVTCYAKPTDPLCSDVSPIAVIIYVNVVGM